MKAAKPLHIVLATNPNPTRARGYPLNINPKPDPKPDSISGPAGSGRVADLYPAVPERGRIRSEMGVELAKWPKINKLIKNTRILEMQSWNWKISAGLLES